MIWRRLSDVRDRVRAQGLRPVALLVWSALRERILPPWQLIYWIPVTEVLKVEIPPGTQFLVIADRQKDLTQAQQRGLAQALGESALPIVDERLARGAMLHTLWVDGQVAGTIFTVSGEAKPFQHIPLTERDAISLDARITPAFRGRGLYPLLLAQTIQALRERRVERFYTASAETNTPSLRSYDKVGLRFLTRYRQIGRQKYVFGERAL